MLKWTATFFFLMIACGVVGFTNAQGEMVEAGFLFLLFFYLTVVSAFLSGLSGNPPLAWLRDLIRDRAPATRVRERSASVDFFRR
ncbi:MAG TPA: hypothetical protein VFY27_11840 [Woeseiaceae bacterium]|nr:hypothetical protein [Woeseiaceae bacterium]